MSSPLRARLSDDLLGFVETEYGITADEPPQDLGGFHHLNARIGKSVVRVYAPWNDESRVQSIQAARQALVDAGLPFAETLVTKDGRTVTAFEGRSVEMERFVDGENMNTWARMLAGMPTLAKIHETLRSVEVGSSAQIAPHPNHISTDVVLTDTLIGAEEIYRRASSDAEGRCADLAIQLAHEVDGREARIEGQLVHGDFWDNNVLFNGNEVAIVLDLDFMGVRPRVDDVALTLYYTLSTVEDSPNYFPGRAYDGDRIGFVRELVDAYGMLNEQEERSLPFAIARTSLCFVAMAPKIESDEALQAHLTRLLPDLEWSLELVRNSPYSTISESNLR